MDTSGSNLALYERLFVLYGEQHWWPCKSGCRWEIITGAVLTQNTAWTNVEKALARLEDAGIGTPEQILAIPEEELQEYIRPAGFFKQKRVYLKAVAEFVIRNEQTLLNSGDIWSLRKQLLQVRGVGRETADSILLYAFHKPVFVIDAYTRRVAERHLQWDGTVHYDVLQQKFMESLPADVKLYQEYHALLVALCKESCRKQDCGEMCKRLPVISDRKET